jgi:hypothetical protein
MQNEVKSGRRGDESASYSRNITSVHHVEDINGALKLEVIAALLYTQRT